jgi:hypothetical protein
MTSAFGGFAIGLSLLLAGCQGKSDQEALAETESVKTSELPALRSAAADPTRPEGADGVDAALAKVKAWNERAAQDLKAIDGAEAAIRDAAARALEAARGAEQAPATRRAALGAQVTAARKAADTARASLVDGQARLRKDIDEQVTAVESMLETCNGSETLLVYEGCKGLEAEHTLLLSNIDALSARYQKAEASYGADRAKLEEASAAVALAALR